MTAVRQSGPSPDPGTRPGDGVLAPVADAGADNVAALGVAMRQIDPVDAHALALTYFDGLTLGQAADRLRLPMATIQLRVSRGLRHLGRALVPIAERVERPSGA